MFKPHIRNLFLLCLTWKHSWLYFVEVCGVKINVFDDWLKKHGNDAGDKTNAKWKHAQNYLDN